MVTLRNLLSSTTPDIEEVPNKIEEHKIIILKPLVLNAPGEYLELTTIEVEEGMLRIDFIYTASNNYINGGWVQISPFTYVRCSSTGSRYQMINAVNIPLSPLKHYFRHQGEQLAYSLFFERPAAGTVCIDIIEGVGPGHNWFNFYGVYLQIIASQPIRF